MVAESAKRVGGPRAGRQFRLPAILGALATACLAMAFRHADGSDQDPAGPGPVTFAKIAAAEASLDLRLQQIRSVLEPDTGNTPHWTSMRESLVISPDPATGEPRFALELIALDPDAGAHVPPAELQRRRAVFHAHAGYLHRYGSLRIDDPELAAANYTIVPLGARSRLGRPTQRVVVLPRQIGRNPWVLEVDSAPGYPLFRAEFDAAGRAVSTLEVIAFEQVDAARVVKVDWWQPARSVQEFASPAEGIVAAIGQPAGSARDTAAGVPFLVPKDEELPAGYALDRVRVVRDDLRPESSLVLDYTDGIDDFFVVQTANVPEPNLPAPAGPRETYAIFVYHEQNVAQLMFHAGGVQTMVIGRGGPLLLAPLAHDLLARQLGR